MKIKKKEREERGTDNSVKMRSPSLSSSKQRDVGGRGGGGGGCSDKKAAEATSCCGKVGLKRGPWTAEEDQLLAEYIKREGEGRWRTLPTKAGLLRCGKSCRLRWMNYLRPSVKRGHISPDEEDLILRLHRLLGNRWSLIAGRIPGRTDNEIKNYWNTHLSKKLISQGIDPKTHKPLAISSNPNPSINSHNYNNLETDIPSEAAAVKEDSASGVHDHHSGKDDQLQKNCNDYIDQGMIIVSDVENGDEEKDEDDDDETSKTYADDAFSSFLNSLINDDMFNNQQNEQDHQENQQSS